MKQEDSEFMQHDLRLPELTIRGMLLGAVLTVIFTASHQNRSRHVGDIHRQRVLRRHGDPGWYAERT